MEKEELNLKLSSWNGQTILKSEYYKISSQLMNEFQIELHAHPNYDEVYVKRVKLAGVGVTGFPQYRFKIVDKLS